MNIIVTEREGLETHEINNVVDVERVYPDDKTQGGISKLVVEYRPFGGDTVEDEYYDAQIESISLTYEEKLNMCII